MGLWWQWGPGRDPGLTFDKGEILTYTRAFGDGCMRTCLRLLLQQRRHRGHHPRVSARELDPEDVLALVPADERPFGPVAL